MSRRPLSSAGASAAVSSSLSRVPAAEVAARGDAARAPWLVALVRADAAAADADDAGAAASGHLLEALRALAGDWQSRVGFAWADVDEAPAAMDDLRVFHVPELLLFADGRLLERGEGELSPSQLAAWLEHALGRR